MQTSEFIEKLSILLREHGFAWVDDSVREAIAQGADVERKEASAVRLSKRFRESGEPSKLIAESENYLVAFETKPGRATATVTREYTIDEIANLYLTAVYSVFVEPGELSQAGLELLGPDVESVMFVAEDGSEKLDLRNISALPTQMEILSELASVLRGIVRHAS